MESNSDNKLRDKLSGIEPAFDPAAWDKMEALLDKKKKRRFFIWWWTGGIAAALLLTVGGYQAGRMLNTNEQLAQHTIIATNNSNTNQTPAADSNTPVTSNTTNTTYSNSNTPNTGNTTTSQPASSTMPAGNSFSGTGSNANSKADAGNKPATGKQKQPLRKNNTIQTNNSQSNPANGFVAFNKNSSTKSKKGKRTATSTTTGSVTTTGTTAATATNPAQQETLLLNNAAATYPELLYLQRMEASLLPVPVSENAVTAIDKAEENVLPKAKKKIFHYSLGIAAHVSGATVGTEGTGTANNMFYKSPTWLVGFTHDFTFINRIAITNGVMYGQTSYEVKKPKTVNYTKAPLYYNSHISEVAIPIGIKVYPVVKNNFSFYISTGIINHIKLKETFSYTVPADTPIANTAFDPTGVYPPSNTFTEEVKSMDNLTSSPAPVSTTNDFSINNSKRYYASFYAGAGFAYTAKKHFVLFAEPVFYMGLQKIGVQDKRKYNLGITGGFRYQF
ncbi:MAG TPA: outer membrane beta-barrel protein [Chitinophagales bacterium]|nr:outer membrane beta-barrel protein [Chitinophagales bacterium]